MSRECVICGKDASRTYPLCSHCNSKAERAGKRAYEYINWYYENGDYCNDDEEDEKTIFCPGSETCVLCGDDIPEGTQLCPACRDYYYGGDEDE